MMNMRIGIPSPVFSFAKCMFKQNIHIGSRSVEEGLFVATLCVFMLIAIIMQHGDSVDPGNSVCVHADCNHHATWR